MLKVSHLSFSYRKNKQILTDVSFEIKDKEVAVILGPNGVGKTTLINCLLGFNKVKDGEILVDNINTKELSYKEKSTTFAYVPQNILRTDLTCEETLILGRLPFYKIYPNQGDKSKVDEIIRELSLEDIRYQTTKEMSGGERQKIAIATSLLQDSKIIVFDEPTSNLDIKAQLDILSLIKEQVTKKNKSAIISMHDINHALLIGDTFIFLKDGKIYKQCQKEEIDPHLLEEIFGIKVKIIKDKGGTYIHYEN